MNILIAGDLIPTQENYDFFINGESEKLLHGDLLHIWNSADYRVVNLETPLTNHEQKISKHGLNVKANPLTVKGIKALKIDYVNLANNHILDYGQIGLGDTIDCLNKGSISYLGLAQHSSKEYVVIDDGRSKVGVLGCSDCEFSIPHHGMPGANTFDYRETPQMIKRIKESVDRLIVLYHGGTEFYQYPTVILKKICYSMVDAGADVVVCQHGHCIAAFEQYNGGTIVYGQGHFISNLSHAPELQTELIVKVYCSKNNIDIEYVPVEVVDHCYLRVPSKSVTDRILNDFYGRSKNLDDEFLIQKYEEWLKNKKTSYLMALKGNRLFDRIMIKIFGKKYVDRLYTQEQLRVIYDYLSNYAHLEAIQNIMKKEIGL